VTDERTWPDIRLPAGSSHRPAGTPRRSRTHSNQICVLHRMSAIKSTWPCRSIRGGSERTPISGADYFSTGITTEDRRQRPPCPADHLLAGFAGLCAGSSRMGVSVRGGGTAGSGRGHDQRGKVPGRPGRKFAAREPLPDRGAAQFPARSPGRARDRHENRLAAGDVDEHVGSARVEVPVAVASGQPDAVAGTRPQGPPVTPRLTYTPDLPQSGCLADGLLKVTGISPLIMATLLYVEPPGGNRHDRSPD